MYWKLVLGIRGEDDLIIENRSEKFGIMCSRCVLPTDDAVYILPRVSLGKSERDKICCVPNSQLKMLYVFDKTNTLFRCKQMFPCKLLHGG